MIDYQIIEPQALDFNIIKDTKLEVNRRGNPGTARVIHYKHRVTAFDIETSKIALLDGKYVPFDSLRGLTKQEFKLYAIHGIMYVWQFAVSKDLVVVGRTWDEFRTFIDNLCDTLKSGERLVTFVHNLSFEMQFLKSVLQKEDLEIMYMDSRKVLSAVYRDKVEFRCSYLQTNMSLDAFTKKMGAKHQKLSGIKFDYNKYRDSKTKMTQYEIEYACNDVVGLVEAMEIQMRNDSDNLQTLPRTSTGYVRRDVKQSMRPYRMTINDLKMNLAEYQMCREAFRGGDTHASRFYAGDDIENVKSHDRSSSYPDCIMNDRFPMGKWFHAICDDFEQVLDLVFKRDKAVLMRVAIHGLRLKDQFHPVPYLTKDKCRNIQSDDTIQTRYDNGRILQSAYLETTITDVDLRIILNEYRFDNIVPIEVLHCRYGKLPRGLTDVVREYYDKKTSLKDIAGMEYLYGKSKNKLNAIYGMMVTALVKPDWILGTGYETIIDPDFNEDVALKKANSKLFLAYQWGVWVTAWARYRLHEMINIVGDDFIYCDTDSVKYVGNHDKEIKAYNKNRITASKESKAYAKDPSGKIHYMGVYELDGEYTHFKTLGAKKYAYIDKKGLHITISGVNKSIAPFELAGLDYQTCIDSDYTWTPEDALTGFNNLKIGFSFREAGGTQAVYNDMDPFTIRVANTPTEVTTNLAILDSTYTLGITDEYFSLLDDSKKFLTITKNMLQ